MDTQKLWNAIDKAVDYADANKEKLFVAGSMIFGGYKMAEKLTRNVGRVKRAKEDRYHREREIYDRSTGVYLQLSRPMTSVEQYEYSMRVRKGDAPAMILAEMGLLDNRRKRVSNNRWRL